MVIIKMMGGLGNQLFIYAFARFLEVRKGISNILFDCRSFQYDPYRREYLLPNFQIKQYPQASKALLKQAEKKGIGKFFLRKTKFFTYLNEDYDGALGILNKITSQGNYYIKGYFHDLFYVEEVNEFLAKEIVIKEPVSNSTSAILEKIKNCNSVAIHIRQKWNFDQYGKFARQHQQRSLPAEYYREKMLRLAKYNKNCVFFIMGDDTEWAKKNLPEIPGCENIFIDNHRKAPDYEDLFLIAYCKYHITSNSSFSWWGKWLSEYYP
jgi:hypothetical protein